jgi:hypothetical protein
LGGEEGVETWRYCLMPNHVHLIGVPKTEDGLRYAIALSPHAGPARLAALIEDC